MHQCVGARREGCCPWLGLATADSHHKQSAAVPQELTSGQLCTSLLLLATIHDTPAPLQSAAATQHVGTLQQVWPPCGSLMSQYKGLARLAE